MQNQNPIVNPLILLVYHIFIQQANIHVTPCVLDDGT